MHHYYTQFQSWLSNKPHLKNILENIAIFFVSALSSFLAAYVFRSFIVPGGDPVPTPLITGGVSGISQITNRLFDVLNLLNQVENRTLQAIFYLIFNHKWQVNNISSRFFVIFIPYMYCNIW